MRPTWLVAYDFSQLAHAALATAAAMLTKQGGGRLIVAHVHQIHAASDGLDLPLVATADFEKAYVADATQQLAEEVAAIDALGLMVERRLLAGRPAPTICHLATEAKAQLAVVGSHGRRGLARVTLGSVAEAILRQAPCDVLVVRAPIVLAQPA